jgi:hypothetical protein
VVASAGTNISGTLGFTPFGTGGGYTTNSVDFIVGSTTPVANNITGDFVGLVTAFDLAAPFAVSIDPAPVAGITFNTPANISIANFITFGSGTGLTPQRFAFDLTSIKTIQLNGSAGTGYGVLRDTLGTFNTASAAFTYSFVSPTNYSISFVAAAIPEPSTYAALIGAMTLGVVAIRRGKRTSA